MDGKLEFELCLYWLFRAPRLYLLRRLVDGILRGGELSRAASSMKLNAMKETVPGARIFPIKLHPQMQKEKVFSIPLSSLAAFQETFVTLCPEWKVYLPPPRVLVLMKYRFDPPPDSKAMVDSLGALWEKLYDFQKQTVLFFIRRQGRGLVCLDMGLGKTIVSMAVATYFSKQTKRPILVICPSSLRMTWQAEFIRHGVLSDPSEVVLFKTHTTPFRPNARLFVMSYGLINSSKFQPKLLVAMKSLKFSALIFDESHKIKNMQAKRTKFALKLARRVRHVLLLTGTPLSRPEEMYSQLKAVDSTMFPRFFPFNGFKNHAQKDLFYFSERYCKPEKTFIGYGRSRWSHRGADHLGELHAVLKHTCLYRLTKNEVLKELPDKLRERVVIHKAMAKKYQCDMETVSQVRDTKGKTWGDAEFMKVVRETSKMKQKFVIKYIEEVLKEELNHDPTLKILLFAHHHELLDALAAAFSSYPSEFCIAVDGRTPMKKRSDMVTQFQTNPKIRVAVLGIDAMGVGHTLTAARLVVFAELVFSPKNLLQAEDRAHRIGQTAKVCIRYLVASGTVDDLIWGVLCKKVRQATATLEGREHSIASVMKKMKCVHKKMV